MLFEIPELTPDDRPWRIDWLGHLQYLGVVRRYLQPYISVAISPVSEDGQSNIDEQRDVWIQLGALPMLNVGDIWRAGNRTDPAEQDLVTFHDLQINRSSTKLVKAGVEIDGAFLLPFADHPWHRAHTHSYCITHRLNDAQQLIIPCMELIRFYFGSSSSLLHTLITPPFDEKRLWTNKHYDPETRHLHICLSGWLPSASAPDVARIAMSATASKAAAQIYASCAKATSSKQPAYPSTFFPFEGKTTLQVTGIWLPNEHGPCGQFVVSSLRSCSHHFPFGSLTYEVGEKVQAKKDKQAKGKQKPIVTYDKPQKQALSDEDPGSAKRISRFNGERKVRFPDLVKKRVWLEKIESQDEPKIIMMPNSISGTEAIAFGLPEGSGNARAIDATDGYRPADDMSAELPKFAKLGIEHFIKTLGTDELYECRPLIKTGQTSMSFALPLLVDSDGVIDERMRFTEPNGTHRQRMACHFGLYQQNQLKKAVAIVEGKSVRDYPVSSELKKLDMSSLLKALLCNE